MIRLLPITLVAVAMLITLTTLLFLTTIGPILFAGAGLIGSAWFLFLFGQSVFNYSRDLRCLKTVQNRTIISRQQIYEQFDKFKTSYGRLRYALFLQNWGVRPLGNWPNGQIPNEGDDEASALIAQLEEKWLGLDK